jgi:hypothetical protein
MWNAVRPMSGVWCIISSLKTETCRAERKSAGVFSQGIFQRQELCETIEVMMHLDESIKNNSGFSKWLINKNDAPKEATNSMVGVDRLRQWKLVLVTLGLSRSLWPVSQISANHGSYPYSAAKLGRIWQDSSWENTDLSSFTQAVLWHIRPDCG